MKEFYFFTDGATEPTNPGPSSYAFLELPSYHDKRVLYSYFRYIGYATNNIAELTAIHDTLKYILDNPEHYLDDPSNVIYIYSDSQYALDCIRKWYKQWVSKRKLDGKKNLDIIVPAYESYLAIRNKCVINLEWVRGHSGHFGNEEADRLCALALSRHTSNIIASETHNKSNAVEDSSLLYTALRTKIIALDRELKSTIKELKALHKSLYKEKITLKQILHK